jgi:hypothetical protein
VATRVADAAAGRDRPLPESQAVRRSDAFSALPRCRLLVALLLHHSRHSPARRSTNRFRPACRRTVALGFRPRAAAQFFRGFDGATTGCRDVGAPRKAHSRPESRLEFLRAVHYEATRAGLDPQLVLGLIQVESGFKKYAVSSAGARGFMQVMPFWVKLIGRSDDNLFHCAPTCATAAPSCATTSTSSGRPLPRARSLQRQPRAGRISEHGARRLAQPVEVHPPSRWRYAPCPRISASPASSPSCRASASPCRPWRTASSSSASARTA